MLEDCAKAARLWRLAAAQGYTDAQFMLGYLYSGGAGVPQDRAEAVRLWRLAAESQTVVTCPRYTLAACASREQGTG